MRNNGELVAAWGNLVNRVLGFAYSRYDGKVPQPNALDERDQGLLADIAKGFPEVAKAYEEVRLRDALKEAMRLTREVNRYLDDKAPWTAFKVDKEQAGTSIFVAMRAIDSLKTLFAPVLPFSAEKVHQIFGGTEPLFGDVVIEERQDGADAHEVLSYKPGAAEIAGRDRWIPSELAPGTPFAKPVPLYKVLEALPAA